MFGSPLYIKRYLRGETSDKVVVVVHFKNCDQLPLRTHGIAECRRPPKRNISWQATVVVLSGGLSATKYYVQKIRSVDELLFTICPKKVSHKASVGGPTAGSLNFQNSKVLKFY